MSIRLRLTLLYTAILALTLTVFGAALYNVQAQSTYGREERALAEWVRLVVAYRMGGYSRGPQVPVIPPFPIEEAPWPRRAGNRAVYTQVLDADGMVLIRSENLEGFTLPISDLGLQALRRGEPWMEMVTIDGEKFLTRSVPVVVRGRVIEIVQVARSVADQERYLSTLRRVLVVGGAVAVAFAFVSGWIMAGVVLRPIHRITQTARAIGEARDLNRRVQYGGPNDELGELATTFNTMLAQLEQAYKQQQQFVADVSHELRTPLTTLRGNLGLLRREPPISDEDRAEVLSDMEDECERLIRLVNNLLTLARAEARRSFQREPIQVTPLLEEVCRQAGLLDPDRQIICNPGSDIVVLADRDALKQILLILLDNALKHTAGEVTVSAALERGRVLLSVRDRGPGIEAERLPHIFERFSPVKGGSSGPNTGLGLAIAKSLVEAQGGTITVTSQSGQGSVFTVSLPSAGGI